MNSTAQTFLSIEMPFNEKLDFYSRSFGDGSPIVAITSGFYGDDHNGLYVCHKLIEFFSAIDRGASSGWTLRGRIRIFPALNPLGTLTDRRFWPFDQRDINRSFPGMPLGETTERIAAAVIAGVGACSACMDLSSGTRFFNELPHVRIYESIDVPQGQAESYDLPLIWRRNTTPLLSGSLAHNLHQRGVPTFVLKFGSANRINKFFCRWVFAGILKFLVRFGVLAGAGVETSFTLPPDMAHLTAGRVSASGAPSAGASGAGRTVWPENVVSILSEDAGLFVADANVGDRMEYRRPIGRIVDPIGGTLISEVLAPRPGILFTIRSNPILYTGTLIARIAS